MSANSPHANLSNISAALDRSTSAHTDQSSHTGGSALISSADFLNYYNFRPTVAPAGANTLDLTSPYERTSFSSTGADQTAIAAPLDATKSVQELIDQGVFKQVLSLNDSGNLYIDSAQTQLNQKNSTDGSLFSNDLYKYVGDMIKPTSDQVDLLEKGSAPTLKIQYQSFNGTASGPEPDFIVNKDGTIRALHNPEPDPNDPSKLLSKNIVVEVERNPGDVGKPTAAQQQALDALATYLSARIKNDYPDATQSGVKVDDSQGLISQPAKADISPAPAPDDNLPPDTQSQVQDLNRLGDSGSGSMSPAQANDTFPQTDTPRVPDETDEIAAIKNVVAGFETKNAPEPYYAVSDRGDPNHGGRGYGMGRFAFTADTISDWIDGLSDDDLDAIEELEDKAPPSKDGKPAKGKLAKGTASKLRKIRSLIHHKSHKPGDKLSDQQAKDLENDPSVKDFTNLLSKAWNHGDKPSKDEIDKNLDPQLQEVMAGDLIHKYAVQSVDKAGKVDVGQIVLGMHLGHFPGAEDLKQPENQDLTKAAEQGYPLAVKSAANPDKPVTWNTDSQGQVIGDPNSYFISQFKSKFNPNNHDYHNENCGPTALAMAIKHFGVSLPGGNPDDPQKLIEKTIKAMGYNSLKNGSGATDIARAAKAAGLKTDKINGLDALDKALAENKQVVLFGNPSKSFAAHYNRATYVSPGTGDHWLLIAGRSADGGYVVDDPLSLTGAVTRSAKEISSYTNAPTNARLRGDGVAVWV